MLQQECMDTVKEVPYLYPEEKCYDVPREECRDITEQVTNSQYGTIWYDNTKGSLQKK